MWHFAWGIAIITLRGELKHCCDKDDEEFLLTREREQFQFSNSARECKQKMGNIENGEYFSGDMVMSERLFPFDVVYANEFGSTWKWKASYGNDESMQKCWILISNRSSFSVEKIRVEVAFTGRWSHKETIKGAQEKSQNFSRDFVSRANKWHFISPHSTHFNFNFFTPHPLCAEFGIC